MSIILEQLKGLEIVKNDFARSGDIVTIRGKPKPYKVIETYGVDATHYRILIEPVYNGEKTITVSDRMIKRIERKEISRQDKSRIKSYLKKNPKSSITDICVDLNKDIDKENAKLRAKNKKLLDPISWTMINDILKQRRSL